MDVAATCVVAVAAGGMVGGAIVGGSDVAVGGGAGSDAQAANTVAEITKTPIGR